MRDMMTSIEYSNWHEYYQIEPFGFPRAEARFATIAGNQFGSSGVGKEHNYLAAAKHWFYKSDPIQDKKPTSLFEAMASTYGKS